MKKISFFMQETSQKLGEKKVVEPRVVSLEESAALASLFTLEQIIAIASLPSFNTRAISNKSQEPKLQTTYKR